MNASKLVWIVRFTYVSTGLEFLRFVSRVVNQIKLDRYFYLYILPSRITDLALRFGYRGGNRTHRFVSSYCFFYTLFDYRGRTTNGSFFFFFAQTKRSEFPTFPVIFFRTNLVVAIANTRKIEKKKTRGNRFTLL